MDNFYKNKYIKYESNRDKNQTVSIKEYFDETDAYLRDINNFQNL